MATLPELWQCNKATIYAPLLFAKIIKVRFVRVTIKNKKILYGFSCRRLFNKNNVAPDTHTLRQSETKLLTLCCKARFALSTLLSLARAKLTLTSSLALSTKFAKLFEFSNFYDFSRDGRVSSG